MTCKFKLDDKVKLLESPADAGKSKGLCGIITSVRPTVVNTDTGDVAIAYSVELYIGPNGQRYYGLAARETDLELMGE